MKRYVVMLIDEGWPSFYLTEDKSLFDRVYEAGNEDEDKLIQLMFGDDELYKEFEQTEGIVGFEILGFTHCNMY